MYMKKCSTADAVLAKVIDTEKTNNEQFMKVIAPLKQKK